VRESTLALWHRRLSKIVGASQNSPVFYYFVLPCVIDFKRTNL